MTTGTQTDSPPTGTTPSAPSETVGLLESASRYLIGNYRQAPFVLDRGQGTELFDTDGKRYLDFCAGVAVNALGHAHPRMTSALAHHAGRLMHVSNYFYNAENIQLAEELCTRAGYARAFFCNSGTEANEALLKLARRHFWLQGQKDRTRIIAFHNAFHGRTMGALALTGTPKYREGFGPQIEGVTHVPYGDLAAVEAAMGPDVCAIVVEPVQGEGGVYPAGPGFLKGLRALADAHGALFLLDEVQTGIGRTGTFLASEQDGVVGDAVVLAKGLGGGFPVGALLVQEFLAPVLSPGTHGSTFGGNALASVAARTVLAVLEEEDLLAETTRKGAKLARGLADIAAAFPNVCQGQRGRGLLQGLVLADGIDPRTALGKLRDHGVLATAAGSNALRFTPPLVVRDEEIDEALAAIRRAVSELAA